MQRRQRPLQVVAMLLEAGADKDASMTHGATALSVAAERGQLEVVRLLLEAGADKDAAVTDGTGATALFIAVKEVHF